MLRLTCLLLLFLSASLPTAAHGQESRRIATARGQQARLELTEVLRLGSAFGGDDEFGRLAAVRLGRGGRIYVTDDRKYQLAVFDSAGRLLHRTGREGAGPGELRAPWNLAIDARDSVFVWDWMLNRVSVFAPDLRYVRSFEAPVRGNPGTLEILPDGSLLAVVYAPGARGIFHVVSRSGRLVRSFGPRPTGESMPESAARNLLGGSVDLSGAGLVYSNKSPYELSFLDMDGRVRSRCTGDPRWTTPPRSVLTVSAGGHSVDWPNFVHSAVVIALGGGFFLNQVAHRGQKRIMLDLVSADCTLHERRTITQTNRTIVDHQGNRLVALEEDEFPQVVVYRYRVVRGR